MSNQQRHQQAGSQDPSHLYYLTSHCIRAFKQGWVRSALRPDSPRCHLQRASRVAPPPARVVVSLSPRAAAFGDAGCDLAWGGSARSSGQLMSTGYPHKSLEPRALLPPQHWSKARTATVLCQLERLRKVTQLRIPCRHFKFMVVLHPIDTVVGRAATHKTGEICSTDLSVCAILWRPCFCKCVARDFVVFFSSTKDCSGVFWSAGLCYQLAKLEFWMVRETLCPT